MQDVVTVARLQSIRVQTLPSSLFFKSNVLRESLSVDSQKNSLLNTTEKGVGGSLYISLAAILGQSHLGCHQLLLLGLGNP
jgi:hypothetical protein